jgi:hypothetical protein
METGCFAEYAPARLKSMQARVKRRFRYDGQHSSTSFAISHGAVWRHE